MLLYMWAKYINHKSRLGKFSQVDYNHNLTNILNIDSDEINLEKGFIYVYIGISFLVLSNLLIAMVNQSYTEINQVSDLHVHNLRLHLIRRTFWCSKLCPGSGNKITFENPQFLTFGKKIKYSDKFKQCILCIDRTDKQATINKPVVSNTDILKSHTENIDKIIQKFNQVEARLNILQNMQETMIDKLNKAVAQAS